MKHNAVDNPRAANVAMRGLAIAMLGASGLLVAGCGPLLKYSPAPEHLDSAVPREGIPSAVTEIPMPPPPIQAPRQETYSVVVADVPVRDMLFALARDAQINLDVSGEIQGTVTINAIDQTLPQILDRISRQVSLRYRLESGTLVISPDIPFWRNYRIDYVNLARGSEGEVTVATQIATTGRGDVAGAGASGASAESTSGSISRTTVKSVSDNSFWVLMSDNIRQLVGGVGATGAAGAEGFDPVVANPIAGIISVNATQAQHAHVQAFVDEVSTSSKRQVLIEVTIVEVELSDEYQAGVDWSRVSSQGGVGSDGISFASELLGNSLGSPPVFTMAYNSFDADGSGFTAAVKMLQQFGDAKVLSSPRIMALNNQTALLKVVDERVYFSLEQETIEGTDNNNPRTIVTSTIRTVPVGLVMSVTPQINSNGNVGLNVRPTITRILGFAVDPAPRLIDNGAEFENLVPEIHVNEIESLLEVADGQTVVIGGLMTDERSNRSDGVPVLGRIPGLGNLFKYRNDLVKKTELVVFLRPTVIRGSGVGGAAAAGPPYADPVATVVGALVPGSQP
jgi:MSHA type pilus biogenesis protein MshL